MSKAMFDNSQYTSSQLFPVALQLARMAQSPTRLSLGLGLYFIHLSILQKLTLKLSESEKILREKYIDILENGTLEAKVNLLASQYLSKLKFEQEKAYVLRRPHIPQFHKE